MFATDEIIPVIEDKFKMLPKVNKHLLRNTIRSTDFHNRLKEEDDMWRRRESAHNECEVDHNVRKRGRMDDKCFAPTKRHRTSLPNIPTDNVYGRKLMELEEKDSTRWGHSGYKELYPDEFRDKEERTIVSTTSSSESSNEERSSKRKKKTHKKKTLKKKCKQKKTRKHDKKSSRD